MSYSSTFVRVYNARVVVVNDSICFEECTKINRKPTVKKYINMTLTRAKKFKCSSTVMVSNNILCCGHRPRLLLTLVISCVISYPFTWAVPLVGGMKP